MRKHLVFVGGGHAHLTSLKDLSSIQERGHRVTLISPSPYHYYSGMGPGMLSGIYRPQEARFHIRKLAERQGAAFIKDKVIKIDPGGRTLFLSSGEKIDYDIVSFNTGSEVPVETLTETPQDNVIMVKPVVNLLKARRLILDAIRSNQALNLVVIGGGPAGVEISSNLWRLLGENRGRGEITLIGGKKLMGDAPDKVRHFVLDSFARRGLRVVEGTHVKAIGDKRIGLSDGKEIAFDLAIIAIGIRPSSLFQDSGLPTQADGGLLVNPYLQSVSYPNIFGGGDCIGLEGHSLAKVGVYAVRQSPILHHNLLTLLEGGKMRAFKPQKDFLLIFNMGDGSGIFWKKSWVWKSRLAFYLKDYIDRKFVRTFQVCGESEETFDGIE